MLGTVPGALVEKREGTTMVCRQCGQTLVCRMSRYMHPYPNKLQWQNQDGSAHYRYDGGVFTCTGKESEAELLKKALEEQDELMREAELGRGDSTY